MSDNLGPRLQTVVDEVVDWATSKNLTITPEKSFVILFTPNTHESNYVPAVFMVNPDDPAGATTLRLKKEPEVLGLTLDTHFTFSPHIKAVAAKARRKLNLMRSLAGTSWGSSKETLLLLYKTYIRPTMEYAAPLWFPNACPSSVDLLQRVQAEALRIATGNVQIASLDHLHQETHVLFHTPTTLGPP